MSERSVIHNTFVLERSFTKTPERVFAAFSDPALKQRWFAASTSNHAVEKFELDFRVGGLEITQSRFGEGSPFPGVEMVNEERFQDILPNQRIVTASTMTIGGRRISASLVTVELLATDTGTDMVFTHQAAFFEGSDGPAMRQDGWNLLLGRLEKALA
jgi:uncharacterized protein YndB with AHSA1/START domain